MSSRQLEPAGRPVQLATSPLGRRYPAIASHTDAEWLSNPGAGGAPWGGRGLRSIGTGAAGDVDRDRDAADVGDLPPAVSLLRSASGGARDY